MPVGALFIVTSIAMYYVCHMEVPIGPRSGKRSQGKFKNKYLKEKEKKKSKFFLNFPTKRKLFQHQYLRSIPLSKLNSLEPCVIILQMYFLF